MSQRAWTAKQFKRDFPAEIPNPIRARLQEICNAALRNGLSRRDVVDVFAELATAHPEELPVGAVLTALLKRIDALGSEGTTAGPGGDGG